MSCASLCDRCRYPGYCCTGFTLPVAGTEEQVREWLRTVRHGMDKNGHAVKFDGSASDAELASHGCTRIQRGLPFEPFYQAPDVDHTGQRKDGWRFWCPKLIDGRCSIYQNRPALCVAFEAGSTRLCIEHVPPAPAEDEIPDHHPDKPRKKQKQRRSSLPA